jgi:hypothetical protein
LLFLSCDSTASRRARRAHARSEEGPGESDSFRSPSRSLHFSSLSPFSLTPDGEGGVRTSADVWVAQGRWLVYFIEGFILTQPTVPFLPDAIFCVCAALSYVLLVRAHGLAITWRTYALFPIFCAFPTWAYIAEFYANLPSASLGLLLSSAGRFISTRSCIRVEPASGVAAHRARHGRAGALLAAAVGAYSIFAVTFGLGIVL